MRHEERFTANENDESRRGSVLLFCLGVLALFSMLGTALFFMTKNESRQTREFLDEMRARIAAESGVEEAMGKVLSHPNGLTALNFDLKLSDSEKYLPLEQMRGSVFGQYDMDGDGIRDISGFVSETYAERGDAYKLRVASTQSRLNINDSDSPLNIDTDPHDDQRHPDRNYAAIHESMRPYDSDPHAWPGWPSGTTYPATAPKPEWANPNTPRLSKDPDWAYQGDADYDVTRGKNGKPHPKAPGRLENLLSTLIQVLFPFDDSKAAGAGNLNPQMAASAAKTLMLARRRLPVDRFESMDQIKPHLVPAFLNAEQFRIFESEITLASWQDDNVLRPSFQWKISLPPTLPEFFTREYRRWGLPGPGQPNKFFPPSTSWTMGTGLVVEPDFRPEFGQGDADTDNRYDIYLHGDMQTSHFDRESRSPIDVNGCSLALLRSLILPVSGWYLREAPGVNGLSAEDWSVPIQMGYGNNSGHHPWFVGMHFLCQYRVQEWEGWASAEPSSGYMYGLFGNLTDENSFYYYDEKDKAHLINANGPEGEIIYAGKNGRFGRLSAISLPSEVAWAVADNIYSRVHGDGSWAQYNPFKTWQEFEIFLRDLTAQRLESTLNPNFISGFDEYMADALIANFNPNSRLNDFNPNKLFFLHVDKSQLIANTSELCFHGMGIFSIESHGMVKDAGQSLKAAKTVRALANPGFRLLRLSSQADFFQSQSMDFASVSDLNPSAVLGTSTGNSRTAGLRMPGGALDENYSGHTLQSYPEAESSNTVFPFKPSPFDGFLMLSLMKPNVREYFFEEAGGANTFNAVFNGAFDPETGVGVLPSQNPTRWWDTLTPQFINGWGTDPVRFKRYAIHPPGGPSPLTAAQEYQCIQDDRTAMLPRVLYSNGFNGYLTQGSSMLGPVSLTSGSLYPDGAFSDAQHPLMFEARNFGSSGGTVGSLQFWVKPGFDVVHSNRVRQFFTAGPKGDLRALMVEQSGERLFMTNPPKASNVTNGAVSLTASSDYLSAIGRDFSLYYFAHGGARVDHLTEDVIYPDFRPNPAHEEDWIATRSCYLQSFGGMYGGGYWGPNGSYVVGGAMPEFSFVPAVASSTANHSWKENGAGSETGLPKYNLETRQWNHFALSWGALNSTDPNRDKLQLCINGIKVFLNSQNIGPALQNGFWSCLDPTTNHKNYVRFGECAESPFRNDPADSTFDNIVSSGAELSHDFLKDDYIYGRYYSESDAAYTSPEIPLAKHLGMEQDEVLTLHSAEWTLYAPGPGNNFYLPNHPLYNQNRGQIDGDAYAGVSYSLSTQPGDPYPADPVFAYWGEKFIPVSMNLYNPQNASWYYGESAVGTKDMPCCAGASMDPAWKQTPLRYSRNDSFRFRLHFNMDASQTLYVSPVLDDVTFMFTSNHSRILLWEME